MSHVAQASLEHVAGDDLELLILLRAPSDYGITGVWHL